MQKKNYGNSNISPHKNTVFKKSCKRTKILQDIITLLLIQVSTQAKISSFKNPHIRIDLLLPRGRNPLSYYILYNESKHNILALWAMPTETTCNQQGGA
jgi:hypothetical protein